MYLDSFELQIENKKNSLRKTVIKMWSQTCGKIAMLVHKVTLKKSEKVKTHKTLKLESALFFQSNFFDIFGTFSPNLRPHFQNSFS